MRVFSAIFAALAATSLSCGADPSPGAMRDAAAPDASTQHDASVPDAGTEAICANAQPHTVNIASTAFGARPLRLKPMFELSGPGADSLVEARAQGLIAFIPYRGGLNALAWDGFWDLPFGGEPRWIETGSMTHGGLAGDFDGDGDDDLMILSSKVEATEGLITRLQVWERASNGLMQASEVRRSTPVIGMPFAIRDIDSDGDLDVLAYEQGTPIGYIHDGAFNFARKLLGESIEAGGARETDVPADAFSLAIALSMADRDRDGIEDMLVVLSASSAEFRYIVLPGDGHGGFKAEVVNPKQETGASGVTIADITGDGLEDVISQQYNDRPLLHLTPSVDAISFGPVVDVEPGGLGIRFADADSDGTLDIITSLDDHLTAIARRSDGSFEALDLGLPAFQLYDLDTPNPWLLDYATLRAAGDKPQRLYLLYRCMQAAATP